MDAQIPFGVRGEEVQDLFGYGRFPAGNSVLMGPIELVVSSRDEEAARELLAPLQDDAEEPPAAVDDDDVPTRSLWALARPVSRAVVWLMLGAIVIQLIAAVASSVVE